MQDRAEKTSQWAEQWLGLLDISLDKLLLGLAGMQESVEQYQVLPINVSMEQAKKWLNQALFGLRAAGAEQFIPYSLLARAAWCRWAIVLLQQPDTITQAVQDLQETEEIAQRGGMRLHLIDFHLEAARLALTADRDILNRSTAEHLAAAKKGMQKPATTAACRRLQILKSYFEYSCWG